VFLNFDALSDGVTTDGLITEILQSVKMWGNYGR
jgi:hypothetical protein